MANDMQPKGKNKALTVIIIAIIAVLIVILAVLALTQKEDTEVKEGEKQVSENSALTDEEKDMEDEIERMREMEEESTPEEVKNAKPQVEGAGLVTEDNKVITSEGKEVKNEAEPGSPDAPQQSEPLEDMEDEDIPEEAVKLDVSLNSYSPAEFTVDANTPITLLVTASDDGTHIFKFKDDALKGVATGIAAGQTRAITFKTPGPGEYEFYCDVPGHNETGVMIVQ